MWQTVRCLSCNTKCLPAPHLNSFIKKVQQTDIRHCHTNSKSHRKKETIHFDFILKTINRRCSSLLMIHTSSPLSKIIFCSRHVGTELSSNLKFLLMNSDFSVPLTSQTCCSVLSCRHKKATHQCL